MTGYTHVASALALSYLIGASGPETILCTLGSIAPDIDNGNSFIGSFVPSTIHHFIFKRGYQHRGFLHTPLGAAVIGIPLIYLSKEFAYFIVGYILHLLYDSFNYSGIRLAPGLKRISFAKIKVGSWQEKVVTILTILSGVVLK